MAMAATNWQDTEADAAAVRGLRLLRRQRVRALPVAELADRPARLAVWEAMNEDRLRLDLTQDQYAELLGGSGSSISRFRRGKGKLPKVMSQRLLERHPSPRWKRMVKALVLEDALLDGTLGAATDAD
jgi:hypothetical protein